MSTLQALQAWYRSQCDGDWEQTNGIDIDTSDDPGWRVTIDLVGTKLAGVRFPEQTSGDTASGSWTVCQVKGSRFVGRGGVGNLEEIIQVFLAWANAGNT